MNKKGLAQIPLMIVLLLMAVAIPVATRLVQQNQDTRNQAAGCSQSGIGQCGANGGCSTGYRCIYGANTFHCSYDPACGGFTPTNTPRPVATSTPRPPTPTPNPCSVTTGKPDNCTCSYNNQCASGNCAGLTVCLPKPTNTPAPVCKTAGQLCNTTTQLCCANQGTKCEGAICCVTNGNTAPNKDYCCSRNMIEGKCAQGCQAKVVDLGLCRGAYAAGKFCAANERSETYMFADCSSVIRCVVDNVRCPTATPTTPPACNATPGQYCANSPTSCTNAGNSIGSGSCAGVGYVCCKSAPAPPSATPTPICNGQACVLYCATNGMKPTCGNNGICVCVALPTAIATPTKSPIIPIATNTPPVGNKCPGAEACPNSSNKNLLQSCTPADSDGTPKDSLCATVGKIEPCGGNNYCCPSAGGAWTTDTTKCIEVPPITCKVKIGDYTLNDFSIWRSEYIEGSFGSVSRNTWNADFDCDGKVTLNDFSVWRPNYFNDLLKN